ncbi:benzoate/H(+) symporter BenE family transporter [Alkanindiges sp. WGS2144]|uniref:benzoate/H(+) symporter BenE family transporter n=1 Tax=Alkanindiges sp. WGS2144 TaxID=3366808 RepID=UPI003750A4D7
MSTSSFFKDFSLSAFVASFVTVLVGFTSSAVLVFQAAQNFGASPEQISSWLWALGMGIGLSGLGLSLYYKIPVATAWSTPGAAILIAGANGFNIHEAIGAFIVTGLLIAIAGFSGWFERALKHIPVSLAAAMLAGILLQFGLQVFSTLPSSPGLIIGMLLVYLFAKRFMPRYAILLALALGMIIAASQGQLQFSQLPLQLTMPVWINPEWSVQAIVSLALPLFIVTMASQNLPGVAMIQAAGYHSPTSSVVGWTGTATTLLAPFGAFAVNLAAISAAICLGKEAHENPEKRYIAAVISGIFYLLIGLFGATVSTIFMAFPQALIFAIAGLALFGTIASSLVNALKEDTEREAGLITFLVTASGLSLFGIGAAFWGLMAGIITLLVLKPRAV